MNGFPLILLLLGLAGTAGAAPLRVYDAGKGAYQMSATVEKSPAEWRAQLTPEQYRVLREKGTERAFTGQYHAHHEHGLYRCAGCGLDLFHSDAKYDSGTGWPSFTAPVARENVRLEEDRGFFLVRTEVLCARCGGHLGHVFPDGPAPTGQRYCMNSAALAFVPAR